MTQYDRQRWARWLADDARRIAGSDASGIEHFLSAFGGMGHLNDIIFHPLNGDDITAGDIQDVNDEFRAILDEAYDLASRMLGS